VSRLREALGLGLGSGTPGIYNAITDVPGVRVGHATVETTGAHCTGVTAILPHGGDLYHDKVTAAATVINGYGKMTGLAQIQELGTIETPILLTNTLSVGAVWDACVSWMLDRFDHEEAPIRSINPVVAECNDGRLAEIRDRPVAADHVLRALDAATGGSVEEGCVGAGAGMVAFGWKSGVGTASRVVTIRGTTYTLGALALPNYGSPEQLTVGGVPIGRQLRPPTEASSGAGSIVVVLATNLPCSHRQLGRLCRRVPVGIARTGGTCDGTSGEFAMAFTTVNRVPQIEQGLLTEERINDASGQLDAIFLAVAEATEEAILSALLSATSTTGRAGCEARALPIYEVAARLRDGRDPPECSI